MFFKDFVGGEIPPQKPARRPPARLVHGIVKWSILVLEATDGVTERIIAEAPEHIAIEVAQSALPGVVGADRSSTPEVSAVSNIAETTIAKAKTSWETGEAA